MSPYSAASAMFFFLFFAELGSAHRQPAWSSFHKLVGCRMGENMIGLSRLKQYFIRFGYISAGTHDVSNMFDGTLEMALRQYQATFRLNRTGYLDPITIQQIIRPRCGVPDIIHAVSDMGLRMPNESRLFNTAQFSYFPGRPSWGSKRSLTYTFLPSARKLVDIETLRRIFSAAFSRWSSVVPITFREAETHNSSNIEIGFFSGEHGDDEPFDGRMGTLAHAYAPQDGRLHVDADELWSVDSADVDSSVFDLETVAVHEIGHLLGLGHSSSQRAVMYPMIMPGTRHVQLSHDDINAIQLLYGSRMGDPWKGTETTKTLGS